MKLSYEYGTRQITFTVEHRKRKKLTIQVEAPENIHVIAPLGTPEEVILKMVKEKSKWIVQKLFEIREIEYRKSEKQYVNGESFSYLGRNYSLQLVFDESYNRPEARLSRGKFVVTTAKKDEAAIKKAMEGWFRDKADEKIRERITYYQQYFDVMPKRIVIKEQQKRWGSCTINDELLFNWKSVMAPANLLDYIVVHELCHLIYKNHSKDFWMLLKRVLPDCEERKVLLKNNGIKYTL